MFEYDVRLSVKLYFTISLINIRTKSVSIVYSLPIFFCTFLCVVSSLWLFVILFFLRFVCYIDIM